MRHRSVRELASAHIAPHAANVTRRTVYVCALGAGGTAAGCRSGPLGGRAGGDGGDVRGLPGALLASVVFAFETTRQPLGLLPLLGGCSVAWLVSAALMKHSIMTERIARRGRVVPGQYAADWLAQWHAGEFSSRTVVTLGAVDSVGEALFRLGNVSHQGFPVLDDRHRVVGVVMRRQLASAPHGRRIVELVERPALTVRAADTPARGGRHGATPAWGACRFSPMDSTRR